MVTNLTPETDTSKLNVYYYVVLILWPLYLFLLPPVFEYGRRWVMLYLIFPGIYLFTWLGYLMHESWHRYVPTVNNKFFYNAFALMILSDPQVYFIVHSTHHVYIHTNQDAEFHPIGEIKSHVLRVIYNWLEVLFGVAFLVGLASITLPHDVRFAKKYRFWKFPISVGVWVVYIGGIGYLSHLVFGVTLSQTLLAYALTYWLGSFLLHQSQLIEHGNLIIDGPIQQRNFGTRNLKPAGLAEKIFLFLTHNDSREHILHHTMTTIHSRPFPGKFTLQKNAVMITLWDYLKILSRMLLGKVDHQIIR